MNEQDIPIAIHLNKLLDWLISRRHCNKNWHESIPKIREKINNAIQDMPAHDEIAKLLSGSHINYFHCLKIVEILKETEADSKNIFGRYGSQRMKDWQEIVQLYQKDNIYLAEAAQTVIRNTNYEIPSLKKQISKLEQNENDYNKKAKDYEKSENIARSEFNTICKQLGISGKEIKQELINLLEELPGIYEKVGKNFKSLKPAVELYMEFIKFHSPKEDTTLCLSLVNYVIENGNTSTYEWSYGEKPVSVETPEINIEIENIKENKKSSEIDLGGTDDKIDFGDLDVGNEDDGEIDWGSIETVDISSVNPEEIDFNITLEESGIVVEKEEGGVARGNDAYTVLDNPHTRNQIIDELTELESFFKMRLFENSNENDLLSLSQMQDAPTILQMQTIESISSMMDTVQIVLNDLTNKRTSYLHNIKHSPKYVDMLAKTLKQKLVVVEKMQASKKVVLDRAEQSRIDVQKINPVIDVIVNKTKILQKEITEEISKKYNNRTVLIIGGISTL